MNSLKQGAVFEEWGGGILSKSAVFTLRLLPSLKEILNMYTYSVFNVLIHNFTAKKKSTSGIREICLHREGEV